MYRIHLVPFQHQNTVKVLITFHWANPIDLHCEWTCRWSHHLFERHRLIMREGNNRSRQSKVYTDRLKSYPPYSLSLSLLAHQTKTKGPLQPFHQANLPDRPLYLWICMLWKLKPRLFRNNSACIMPRGWQVSAKLRSVPCNRDRIYRYSSSYHLSTLIRYFPSCVLVLGRSRLSQQSGYRTFCRVDSGAS